MATRRQTSKSAKVSPRQRSSARLAKDILRTLFDALAQHLLDGGVTAHQIADLAKDALVVAAAGSAKMATGRTNHSKVAADTGLSRTEVRRRLSGTSTAAGVPIRALDRTSRVVAGWSRDPLFLDSEGRPRTLALAKGHRSFSELVRMHSGDIPPRVVLDSLISRGLAIKTKGAVSLRAQAPPNLSRKEDALAEASPYISRLLKVASSPNSNLGYAHSLQLAVDENSNEILMTEHVVRVLSAAASAIEARKQKSAKPSLKSRTLNVTLTMVSAPNNSNK